MTELIWAEFKKLKGTFCWNSMPVIAILLPMAGTMINASTRNQGTWESFIKQNLWLAVLLVWPSYLLILGGYLFLCEKKHHTIENLLVIPVSRGMLLCAKLLVLFAASEIFACMTYAANLMILVLGIPLNGQQFLNGLELYLKASAGTWAALLLVFAVVSVLKTDDTGTAVTGGIYLMVSFIAMWNAKMSSIMPLVTVIRFAECGNQISYAFSAAVSAICFLGCSAVSLTVLLLYGYRTV